MIKKITYEELYRNILRVVEDTGDIKAMQDAVGMLEGWLHKEHEKDFDYVLKHLPRLRIAMNKKMSELGAAGNFESAETIRGIIFDSYKLEAPYHFDAYCIALEYDRPVEQQFYLPRRAVLKDLAGKLEDLEYGRIKELFLECPPRIGKTGILSFYITWHIGKHPESSNLYSSYTEKITNAFYNALLEILTDKKEYHWSDIFKTKRLCGQNAKETTFNIDRNKHYPTVTCRSIDGTLNGACDVDGVLVADDLVSGDEEAKSPDRLENLWGKVTSNLITRAKMSARIIWCGTPWSLLDPQNLRRTFLENDPTCKNTKFSYWVKPALNENDESNFEYLYAKGYSTDYYRQIRAQFEIKNDMASWSAVYMCTRIERDGALFLPEGFSYYNGTLPDREPDRVFFAVDPAFGGGDFVAGPICVQYGDSIYIPDVIYNSGDKSITQPEVARKAISNNVGIIQMEANKSTASYATETEAEIKKKGKHITIITKPASENKAKEYRIKDKAPDIRAHFIFLENGKRTMEYEKFMQNVFCFTVYGKNKHDDAPDSLAMAADMAFTSSSNEVRILKRMF